MNLSTEQIISIVTGACGAMGATIVFLFKLYADIQYKRIEDIKNERDFFRDELRLRTTSMQETMVTVKEGVSLTREMLNQLLRQEGRYGPKEQ